MCMAEWRRKINRENGIPRKKGLIGSRLLRGCVQNFKPNKERANFHPHHKKNTALKYKMSPICKRFSLLNLAMCPPCRNVLRLYTLITSSTKTHPPTEPISVGRFYSMGTFPLLPNVRLAMWGHGGRVAHAIGGMRHRAPPMGRTLIAISRRYFATPCCIVNRAFRGEWSDRLSWFLRFAP